MTVLLVQPPISTLYQQSALLLDNKQTFSVMLNPSRGCGVRCVVDTMTLVLDVTTASVLKAI